MSDLEEIESSVFGVLRRVVSDTETLYDSSNPKVSDSQMLTVNRLARIYAGDRSGEIVAVVPVGGGKLAMIRNGEIKIQ